MAARGRSGIVVAMVLLAGIAALPRIDAAGEPLCHALDEWESPARIESEIWCRGIDPDHAFWARQGETINAFARATSGQDIEICLVNPSGVVLVCHDTGGPGNAETITSWPAGVGGWWVVRVFPAGPEYMVSLSLSSWSTEDDCGQEGDAPEAFSTARVTVLPNFARCLGELPAADLGDFYKADLERGGRLEINTTVAARLCIYAPRGSLAGGCADVDPDGSAVQQLDETGMWRFAVRHRPGSATGEYSLGAIYTPPNHAPMIVQHACSPQGAHAGDPVTCQFRASEPDGDTLYYLIDWGDGSATQRVPPAGFVTQALSRSAAHGFPTGGTYPVSVIAFDNRTDPGASAVSIVNVQAAQARPVMAPISCVPAAPRPGDEVSCTFFANDDSSGVAYTLNWGDGTPSERVPEVGLVAPGEPQSASRTFLLQGTRTLSVFATDDGAPSATSATATRALVVAAAVPSAPLVDCGSDNALAGAPLVCRLRATDADSQNIAYTLDWGDGNVERVPATGYVQAGVFTTAQHTYPSSGYRTLLARASDDTPFPQSGPLTSAEVVIGTMQTATGSNVAGTPLDINQKLASDAPVVDGTWVELAAPGRGNESTPVRLSVLTGSLGGDLDVRFYADGRRTRLDAGECANEGNGPEACNAPAGARWAFVRSAALAVSNDWRLTYVY